MGGSSQTMMLLLPPQAALAAINASLIGGWHSAPSAADIPRRGEVRHPAGYSAKPHILSPLPGEPNFRGSRAWHE